MHAEFRFTRYGCGAHIDAYVKLSACLAESSSVVASAALISPITHVQAALAGVASAVAAVPGHSPLSIVVEELTEPSGPTGDLSFKVAAEAAAYHLLGVPEKAPFPGYVLGGA
jgi:hypothetical protein